MSPGTVLRAAAGAVSPVLGLRDSLSLLPPPLVRGTHARTRHNPASTQLVQQGGPPGHPHIQAAPISYMNECGTGQTSYYKVSHGQQPRWRRGYTQLQPCGASRPVKREENESWPLLSVLVLSPRAQLRHLATKLGPRAAQTRRTDGEGGGIPACNAPLYHRLLSPATPHQPLLPTRTGSGSVERPVSMVWVGCRRSMRRKKHWEAMGADGYDSLP